MLGQRPDAPGSAEGDVEAAYVDDADKRAEDGDRRREDPARIEEKQPQRWIKLFAGGGELFDLLACAARERLR